MSQPVKRKRIGIIGYGSAGQALAIDLARKEHNVTIFEQAPAPRPVGAGFLLQPTGLAMMAKLGLAEEVMACGNKIDKLIGHNHSGRTVMSMAYSEWSSNAHGIGLQRGALFSILQKALPQEVTLLTGQRIVALDTKSGLITNGAGEQFGPFDIIVAADGAHSILRKMHFGESGARLYPWGAWWCLLPQHHWPFSNQLRQRYRLARNMIGILPVGHLPQETNADDKLCFYWSVPAIQKPSITETAKLPTLIEKMWPEVAQRLRDQSTLILQHATYRGVGLSTYYNGRAIWIGDAAHGMSPQLGQGVNMALLDALALSQAIESYDNTEAIFAHYKSQRHTHVRWYRWFSHLLTPLFQSEYDWLARGRDIGFGPSARIPGIRGMMLKILTGTFGLKDRLR